MKIIFIHASAGAGHRKAAEALFHYFKENSHDISLEIVDVLDMLSPFYRIVYNFGYSFLINRAPWGWRFGFWFTGFKFFRPITKFVSLLLDETNSRKLIKFFLEQNPDMVISTHFLPSEICAFLKRKGRINSGLITVVTDFDVHPYWVHPGTDVYVVASDFTKKRLILQNVESQTIREFGIPVDPKFFQPLDRKSLRNNFNLKENETTVLVMTGSFGIGPIKEIVGLLHTEAQVLVVCAKNKKLYKSLIDRNYSNVRVFGFVDIVQELMSICDIIVTKPGGLTTVEVLTMELTPVFISAIPGQEVANARALATYGIGVSAHDPEEVRRIVLDYKRHPEKISKVKERMNKIRKPNAARDLFYEVCPGCFRNSG